MGDTAVHFDWIEYSVFVLMLLMSAVIGVYFCVVKPSGQQTMIEYVFGGRTMPILPVSTSLVCTYISGISLLGTPTEVYTYGTQYLMMVLSVMVSGFLFRFATIPVFYKLQMVSLYEYLEMRFDSSVRKIGSLTYILFLITYIPIVIYSAVLAINQVTGADVVLTTITVSAVCIFYTTIGGLKAVVWTDTLQGALMSTSLLAVAVVGTRHVGGIANIMEAAKDGDRFDFFILDPDPRRRLSIWTVLFGLTFVFYSDLATNASYMQRFTSLPTIRKAQWSAILFFVGCLFFILTTGYLGLALYTKYRACDPLSSGLITRPDQILPLFVMETSGQTPGLAGAFLAGLVSAALSSMSTGLHTVGGTLYSDFFEPFVGRDNASSVIKLLVVVFGVICTSLVMLVDKFGNILEFSLTIQGLAFGPLLGIFFLGIFLPQANSKGAFYGGIGSIIIMVWLSFGSKAAIQAGDIVYETKPLSTSGCNFTLTSTDRSYPAQSYGNVFFLYEISGYYSSTMGCIITILIGLIVSYLTGPNKPEDVNRDLLSPLIQRYLPTYSTVPTKEMELTINEMNKIN